MTIVPAAKASAELDLPEEEVGGEESQDRNDLQKMSSFNTCETAQDDTWPKKKKNRNKGNRLT